MLSYAEIIKVMENEKACVLKNINGCDRDCANCELALPDDVILEAYDAVIMFTKYVMEECKV